MKTKTITPGNNKRAAFCRMFQICLVITVTCNFTAAQNANRVETLYRSGIESRSKAGYTDDADEKAGYLEAAIKLFTEALKIEPRNTKILHERGEIYLEQGELQKALADAQNVLRNAPPRVGKAQPKAATVYDLFGRIYQAGFYLDKAVEAYSAALRYAPKNAEIYVSRGFVYQYIGEKDKADADFSKADRLSRNGKTSSTPFTVVGEGAASTSSGQRRRIEIPEVFQIFHFQEVGGYYDGFLGVADSKEAEQKIYRHEIEKAKKIVEFNPKSPLAHWKLANLLLRAGRYDEAVTNFLILLVVDPSRRYEYANNSGVALAEKGRLRNAVVQFEGAIKFDRSRLEAFYNRGLCRLKIGEHENAVADFTRVVELAPNFVLGYKSRAKALRALGRNDEADADEKKVEIFETL